jgi:hypothetical protein
MREARARAAWEQTAAIVAAVINAGNAWPSTWSQAWHGPAIEPVEADDVNPYTADPSRDGSRRLNRYSPEKMARMQKDLDARRGKR